MKQSFLAFYLASLLEIAGCGQVSAPIADSSGRSIEVGSSIPHSVDGKGGDARFALPVGLAFDSKGNLFLSDVRDHFVRRISPLGVVETIAGAPGSPGRNDGTGINARFACPNGIAIDDRDNLYVADSCNETIRKISPKGEVTTTAGSDGRAGNVDGIGFAAKFDYPEGIAIDELGNVYVTARGAVRKINRVTEVTLLAGYAMDKVFASKAFNGYQDGQGEAVRFNTPRGIVSDRHGNVYVVDVGNRVIRKIDSTGLVTTLAGAVGGQRSTDGQGAQAEFGSIGYIAIDSTGNLYVPDCRTGKGKNADARIRKISPSGLVTSIMINGQSTLHAQECPQAIVLDSYGTIYVSISSGPGDGQWDAAIEKIGPDGKVIPFVGPM